MPTNTRSALAAGPVRLVIAPAFGRLTDLNWLAATLALWFDAPLQLATDDDAAVAALDAMSAYADLETRPVLHVDEDTAAEVLSNQLLEHAPAVMALPATPAGYALARRLDQPSFLVPALRYRRLPTGPLVVPVTGGDADVEIIAVAALWAAELGTDVRLVVTADGDGHTVASRSVDELAAMGVAATVETLDDLDTALADLATRAHATAVVLPVGDPARLPPLATPLLWCPVSGRAADTASVGRDTAAPPSDLDELSEGTSMGLIATRTVGRLAYIEDDAPHIVPINYRVHDDTVFIRSLPGHKLAAASRHDRVCLEIDEIDERRRGGWSVVAHGTLELIEDPSVLAAAWDDAPDPWIGSTEHRWLRLVIDHVTGRQTRRG